MGAQNEEEACRETMAFVHKMKYQSIIVARKPFLTSHLVGPFHDKS